MCTNANLVVGTATLVSGNVIIVVTFDLFELLQIAWAYCVLPVHGVETAVLRNLILGQDGKSRQLFVPSMANKDDGGCWHESEHSHDIQRTGTAG